MLPRTLAGSGMQFLGKFIPRITGAFGYTLSGSMFADRNQIVQDANGTIALVDTLVSGFKNKIINGSFGPEGWQRGTTFAVAGYTADRWLLNFTGTAPALSRQTRTPGAVNRPGIYFLRLTTTAATANPTLEQRIESVTQFSAENMTLSLTRKSAGSSRSVAVNVIQCFGTGGAPSANVTTSSTVNFNTAIVRDGITIAIPSISGKTLGTNGDDYLSVLLAFPTGTIETYDIYDIQDERGSVVTDFEQRPSQVELQMCQRYYWKTFPQGVAPAQNAGEANVLVFIQNAGAGANQYNGSMEHPVSMRANPTLTAYNPSAANAQARNQNTATDCTLTVFNGTRSNDKRFAMTFTTPAASGAGQLISVHITAESEL